MILVRCGSLSRKCGISHDCRHRRPCAPVGPGGGPAGLDRRGDHGADRPRLRRLRSERDARLDRTRWRRGRAVEQQPRGEHPARQAGLISHRRPRRVGRPRGGGRTSARPDPQERRCPVVGVRHLAHIDPDPQWMMREEVGAGLTVLEREGLCFDLVVREWQLPQATRLAARHGGLRFVLDHLGGPPEPGQDRSMWASRLRDLARQPNVVAKVSGLTSGLAPGSWRAADLAAPVTIALGSFGPGRLLYGSDWPLAELGGGAAPGSPLWKPCSTGFPSRNARVYSAATLPTSTRSSD
ncbi:hypothetical protein E4K10_04805 [Streptomyces sp. T1317-0309]|nr:hypothetical protein E4K10_04805 [Streptomyces sp. T1317-0309]